MRILVYKNKKLFEKLKKIKPLSTYKILFENKIEELEKEKTLPIIDYNDLIKIEEKMDGKIFLLYTSNKNIRKAIKYLKRGAIDIISEDFSDSEIIETLENAIESMKLFEGKVLNKEVEKIKEIAFDLFSSYNLSNSLQNIIDHIRNIVGIERVFISIVKRNREKILASEGQNKEKVSEFYGELKSHPWLKILEEKKDFVRFNKDEINELAKVHKEDFIKFPLFLKDKLIGVITIDNYTKPLPQDLNTEIMMIISLLLSIHIENYRIYGEVIKTKEALRKKEEKEFLQKLTMSLNHEINNPLTIAYLNLESLKRKIPSKDNVEKNLTGLEVSLERIKGIMNNINKLESDRFVRMMRKRELIDFRYEA